MSPSTTPSELISTADDWLMAQVHAGRADAFEELYDRYWAGAYRVAWRVCRDEGRAEDAVQEAFASLWRGRASYRCDRGNVGAWLLSTVRYRAIDVTRRDAVHADRRAGPDALYSLHASGDLVEQTVSREDACRLQTLVRQLPDAQRAVITLAYYGELSHTEIATHLGLSAGTVKGRVRLGLHKLRKSFHREA